MLSLGMDVEQALRDEESRQEWQEGQESVEELMQEGRHVVEQQHCQESKQESMRSQLLRLREVSRLVRELSKESRPDVKENRLGASRGSEERVRGHGTVLSRFDEHGSPDQGVSSPWPCVEDLMGAEPVRVETHPIDYSSSKYLSVMDYCLGFSSDAKQVRGENHRRSSPRFGEHRSQEQNMLSSRVYYLKVPEIAHRTDFSFSRAHLCPGEYMSRLGTRRDFIEAEEVRDTSLRSLGSERTL